MKLGDNMIGGSGDDHVRLGDNMIGGSGDNMIG